jgi:uncharacterized membrane protein
MRLVGARELAAGIGLLTQQRPSFWVWARVAGDSMDLALLGAALRQPSNQRRRLAAALSAVLGVTLADVGAAQAMRRDDGSRGVQFEKAITVAHTPQEVYRFWRDFRNLPTFTSHLESVAVLDDRRSHWTARGPGGRFVEWDAEVVEDRPDALIAWQSVPGSDVQHSGRVRFDAAPGGRGTEVRVQMQYVPPAGVFGATIARFFGQEPRQQVQSDLRKLKQVLETGEVIRSDATLAGTHVFQRAAQPQGVNA